MDDIQLRTMKNAVGNAKLNPALLFKKNFPKTNGVGDTITIVSDRDVTVYNVGFVKDVPNKLGHIIGAKILADFPNAFKLIAIGDTQVGAGKDKQITEETKRQVMEDLLQDKNFIDAFRNKIMSEKKVQIENQVETTEEVTNKFKKK